MSKSLVSQIIREAKSLITNPSNWTQDTMARTAAGDCCDPRNANAVQFCALGALIKVIHGMAIEQSQAKHLAESTVVAMLIGLDEDDKGHEFEILTAFNDDVEHKLVLAFFDIALEAETR